MRAFPPLALLDALFDTLLDTLLDYNIKRGTLLLFYVYEIDGSNVCR